MLKSLHIYIKIFLHYIFIYMKVKVKVAQSCLTLCNPMEYTVHGILQARILEWVALPFSRGSSQPRDQTQVSHISGVFLTSWAIREDHTYIYVYVWWFYIYIYIHIYIWFDSSITLLTEHQCLPLDYWATLRVLIVLKGGCVQFSLYNWRRAGVWSVHYWQNSLLRHGIAVKIWSHTICLLVLDHCMTL